MKKSKPPKAPTSRWTVPSTIEYCIECTDVLWRGKWLGALSCVNNSCSRFGFVTLATMPMMIKER